MKCDQFIDFGTARCFSAGTTSAKSSLQIPKGQTPYAEGEDFAPSSTAEDSGVSTGFTLNGQQNGYKSEHIELSRETGRQMGCTFEDPAIAHTDKQKSRSIHLSPLVSILLTVQGIAMGVESQSRESNTGMFEGVVRSSRGDPESERDPSQLPPI
jgi:hypothetical protein